MPDCGAMPVIVVIVVIVVVVEPRRVRSPAGARS
jgi:hypothetical protein